MDNNDLKHVGVLGMRWGSRRNNSLVTTVRGKSVPVMTTVRGKKVSKMELVEKGKGISSAHQKKLDEKRIAKAKEILNKKFEPMTKKDQKFFKNAAKAVVLGIAIVGSAKISAHLIDRAASKLYAKKSADAIVNNFSHKAIIKMMRELEAPGFVP